MVKANEAGESIQFRFLYRAALKKAFGEALDNCSHEICNAFSGRPETLYLENSLRLLKGGCHLVGKLEGIQEGYRAASLISKNKDHAGDVARMVRRHPNLSARQIARKLDALGKEIPRAISGQSQIRSWEGALAARHLTISKRIEKHISRLKIAVVSLNQSLVYKKFIKTGLLP